MSNNLRRMLCFRSEETQLLSQLLSNCLSETLSLQGYANRSGSWQPTGDERRCLLRAVQSDSDMYRMDLEWPTTWQRAVLHQVEDHRQQDPR
jgi:hypothetical protein